MALSAIIMRSALVFHGHNPAPQVHSIVVDHRGRHVVTWDDVMVRRREKQRLILERKRYVEPWRAVKLWVAYFGTGLMGGWNAFITDWRGEGWEIWIDRDGKGYREELMGLFPAGRLPGDWEDWKPAFAKAFRRRSQLRKPVGVVYLWRRGHELRKVGVDTYMLVNQ